MKICISCEKDVEGKPATPVKEDLIIRTVRALKKKLNIAKMNDLYVCQDCKEKHKKRRQDFEKSMLFASVLAGLLVILALVMLLLSGRLDIWVLLSVIVICIFVLAFPLFRYVPALEEPAPTKAASASRPRSKKGGIQ